MTQEREPAWRLHPGWTAWIFCALGLLACIGWLLRDGGDAARIGIVVGGKLVNVSCLQVNYAPEEDP